MRSKAINPTSRAGTARGRSARRRKKLNVVPKNKPAQKNATVSTSGSEMLHHRGVAGKLAAKVAMSKGIDINTKLTSAKQVKSRSLWEKSE